VNVEEARRRFGAARVGHLATADAAGVPHVVPFVFALDQETVYWAVDHKPKRSPRLRRLENIRVNPHAEAVVDHFDERWSRLWWVRASGRAREVEDPNERTHALESLAEKYPQYRDRPPDGPVVAIDVDVWSSWEASPASTSS
jgi:PPOX class probable F420-dependent enzyme